MEKEKLSGKEKKKRFHLLVKLEIKYLLVFLLESGNWYRLVYDSWEHLNQWGWGQDPSLDPFCIWKCHLCAAKAARVAARDSVWGHSSGLAKSSPQKPQGDHSSWAGPVVSTIYPKETLLQAPNKPVRKGMPHTKYWIRVFISHIRKECNKNCCILKRLLKNQML